MRGFNISTSSSSNYAKFGLNTAQLVKFDIQNNPNWGTYIDITFKVGESEIKTRVFEIKSVWVDGKQITNKNDINFIKAEDELAAWFTQLVLAYVTPDEARKALDKDFKSFEEYLKAVKTLIKPHVKNPVDIWLEYEPSIRKNQKRTYLRLPRSTRYGRWITKHVDCDSDWEKVVDEDGIKYKCSNKVHPLTRNAWYMSSNFAKMQKVDDDSSLGGSEDDDISFNPSEFDNNDEF